MAVTVGRVSVQRFKKFQLDYIDLYRLYRERTTPSFKSGGSPLK